MTKGKQLNMTKDTQDLFLSVWNANTLNSTSASNSNHTNFNDTSTNDVASNIVTANSTNNKNMSNVNNNNNNNEDSTKKKNLNELQDNDSYFFCRAVSSASSNDNNTTMTTTNTTTTTTTTPPPISMNEHDDTIIMMMHANNTSNTRAINDMMNTFNEMKSIQSSPNDVNRGNDMNMNMMTAAEIKSPLASSFIMSSVRDDLDNFLNSVGLFGNSDNNSNSTNPRDHHHHHHFHSPHNHYHNHYHNQSSSPRHDEYEYQQFHNIYHHPSSSSLQLASSAPCLPYSNNTKSPSTSTSNNNGKNSSSKPQEQPNSSKPKVTKSKKLLASSSKLSKVSKVSKLSLTKQVKHPKPSSTAATATTKITSSSSFKLSNSKQSKATTTTKKKQSRRPSNKPCRPLSAYNMFFGMERKKIMAEQHQLNQDQEKLNAQQESQHQQLLEGRQDSSLLQDTTSSNSSNPNNTTTNNTSGTAKNPKRIGKHANIGFANLARLVSQRWNALTSTMEGRELKATLEERSRVLKEQYLVELQVWKDKEQLSLSLLLLDEKKKKVGNEGEGDNDGVEGRKGNNKECTATKMIVDVDMEDEESATANNGNSTARRSSSTSSTSSTSGHSVIITPKDPSREDLPMKASFPSAPFQPPSTSYYSGDANAMMNSTANNNYAMMSNSDWNLNRDGGYHDNLMLCYSSLDHQDQHQQECHRDCAPNFASFMANEFLEDATTTNITDMESEEGRVMESSSHHNKSSVFSSMTDGKVLRRRSDVPLSSFSFPSSSLASICHPYYNNDSHAISNHSSNIINNNINSSINDSHSLQPYPPSSPFGNGNINRPLLSFSSSSFGAPSSSSQKQQQQHQKQQEEEYENGFHAFKKQVMHMHMAKNQVGNDGLAGLHFREPLIVNSGKFSFAFNRRNSCL